MSNERVILVPILTVVFVDTLGYAAVVPLIPFALQDEHAPLVAVGAVFAAFSLCQLITAPLLGRLSDRVGRRPVLALSLAGSVVGFALLAISSAFPVVLLSRVIDGSSAGNVAMCYAAVLDSGTEDTRRRWIPALGAAAGAGLVAGLGLSALLAGFGFRAVALAAMFLSLLCLALTLIAVPETRRGAILNLKVSAALRLPKLRRPALFIALCAALQASLPAHPTHLPCKRSRIARSGHDSPHRVPRRGGSRFPACCPPTPAWPAGSYRDSTIAPGSDAVFGGFRRHDCGRGRGGGDLRRDSHNGGRCPRTRRHAAPCREQSGRACRPYHGTQRLVCHCRADPRSDHWLCCLCSGRISGPGSLLRCSRSVYCWNCEDLHMVKNRTSARSIDILLQQETKETDPCP